MILLVRDLSQDNFNLAYEVAKNRFVMGSFFNLNTAQKRSILIFFFNINMARRRSIQFFFKTDILIFFPTSTYIARWVAFVMTKVDLFRMPGSLLQFQHSERGNNSKFCNINTVRRLLQPQYGERLQHCEGGCNINMVGRTSASSTI
ncbi:hypothetical protein V6Z11_D05G384500 [Gossypium hirsutum]